MLSRIETSIQLLLDNRNYNSKYQLDLSNPMVSVLI